MGAPLAGCWNKPRPTEKTTYLAQDGFERVESELGWGNFYLRPVHVVVRHVMTTDCQSLESATASCCAGCKHARAAS